MTTRLSFLSGVFLNTSQFIIGVNTTVSAQRNPALESVVYLTPKVAPIYTKNKATPTKTLYFKVVLFTPRSLFHENSAAMMKAPKNLNAFRVNGSICKRLISIKRYDTPQHKVTNMRIPSAFTCFDIVYILPINISRAKFPSIFPVLIFLSIS